MNFPDLMYVEEARLGGAPVPPQNIQCATGGRADEPRVTFRSEARTGLALSGGGIRSATFALGVLQAMAKRGVLPHLDYLSTVSGGGYAGAFWKRWRAAHEGEIFPGAAPAAPAAAAPDAPEDPALRHLREFSRFLAPRLGSFSMDLWWPVAVILCGLALTLIIGCAFILLVMTGWACLAEAMTTTDDNRWGVPLFCGVLTVAVVVLLEVRNYHYRRVLPKKGAVVATLAASVLLLAAFLWGWPFLPCRLRGVFPSAEHSLSEVISGLFGPACVWLLAGLVAGGVFRMLHARATKTGGAAAGALERVAGRLFAMSFFWALPAGLWAAALFLSSTNGKDLQATATSAAGMAGGIGAGLTALFAIFHKWADKAEVKKLSTTVMERFRAWGLKLIAWLAVLLLYLTAALALIAWPSDPVEGKWYWPFMVALGAAGAACLLYMPGRMSLHSFYRSRIARCYLGAAGAATQPDGACYSAELGGDDIKMVQDTQKPLHLVCCAANHLAGDRLPTLHRGARSAVLSRHGFSMGADTAAHDSLRLSSAVTASAAAFNSQMGSISARLGPAVSFLAALTNLRLGLWMPAPARGSKLPWQYKVFPGLLFYLEALNLSRTNGGMVHLSDGGHFENLAAYELIRRGCRTVIICDGSADPERKFDNLGNLVRRVREDFGVEIMLDASPLKPGEDGHSSAYAVAGAIRYPGRGGEGLLIYIKPALTGNEPEDIRHYRESRPDFPHESTADQFFDEAQWESYRRLGECAGESVFEPAANLTGPGGPAVVFDRVRRGLAIASWNEPGAYDRLGDLTRDMEKEMADAAGGQLLREAWPETAFWSAASAAPDPPSDAEVISALVRVLTTLEEVHCGVTVTSYQGQQVDDPWLNWMDRWLAIPTLHRWWPLLRPLFGSDFTSFAGDRGLPSVREMSKLVRVSPFWTQHWRAELAGSAWTQSIRVPHGRPTQVLRLAFIEPGIPGRSAEVGLILYHRTEAGGVTTLEWDARDLWLPAGWSGTWTRMLLEKAVQHFGSERLMVTHLNEKHLAATEGDYRQFGFNPVLEAPHSLVRPAAG